MLTEGVALEVLAILSARGLEGFVATVSGSNAASSDNDYVFFPDEGDVSSLLITSRTSQEIVSTIAGAAWVDAFPDFLVTPMETSVRLAWLACKLRNDCGIDLDDRQLSSILEWWISTSENGIEAQYDEENGRLLEVFASLYSEASSSEIQKLVIEMEGDISILWLAYLIRKYRPRGIRAASTLSFEEMFLNMICSYDRGEFENQKLFWKMRSWELRNPGYPLLNDWRQRDPLDAVLDQRYWRQDLERALDSDSGFESVTVLEMDLDNFKMVNDALGHTVGDDAIRYYCGLVYRSFSDVGWVYRRGGDEVVVIVPNLNSTLVAKMAEEIRSTIEEEFIRWVPEDYSDPPPTVSVGGLYAPCGSCLDEVISEFEAAQKQSKMEGKNRVTFRQLGAS